MSRPLGRLSSGMKLVARGDLQTELAPTGSGDEFDTLMRQFNTMVAGLRDRQAIRRDLGEAATIQRGLLPTAPPQIPGYDVSGGIRYCQHTGGDYYDYVALDGIDGGSGALGIVVGDVTGHGTGSSLLMASARAVLRSAAHRAGGDVSSLMAYLNDHLLRDTPVGSFMTMFYGVLEPDAGRLGWTSAGHEPGVLWRSATDEVTHLRSTDIPLGIDADRPFAAGEPIALAAGDILVIGTDGATQARNTAGQFFGVDRLAAIVRSNAASAAEEIRDAIFRATRAHEATEGPEDDVTLVVVKRVAD
jgi:sigma-B regulation protein RsbU (phosphoserine phosphatase)